MKFGDALMTALQKAGMTPTDLSDATGIDISNISRIIHNRSKPALPTLRTLLRALPATTDLRALLLYDD